MPQAGEIPLRELLDSWTLSLRAGRKSPATVKTYTDGVNAYFRWCEEQRIPAALVRHQVTAFVVDLLDSDRAASTVRSRQLALQRFSAWCAAEGEIDSDSLARLSPPRLDQKVIEPFTEEQLGDLMAACRGSDFLAKRDTALVRFMLDTTARAEEVVSMTVEDLDLKREQAVIRRGKGGRGRVVPLGPKTVADIDRYLRMRRAHRLAGTPTLWLGDRGKGLSYYGLDYALKKRAVAAQLRGFHLHRLRHTAAHRWLAAGGSEQGLMAVAGWKRPDMVMRYTQARASDRALDEYRRLNLGEL